MDKPEFKRKSWLSELKSLTQEYCYDFIDNKSGSFLKVFGFPIIAGIAIKVIAGKNMFVNYEDTRSACFIIMCAAVWCGLFNSISAVVSERANIKQRAATPNFYYISYLGSRLIVHFLICLIQSLILSLVFRIEPHRYARGGLVLNSTLLNFAITIFLLIYVADILGLAISSIVKKDSWASACAPYILIAELILSGTLFKLGPAIKPFSTIMESRFGMEALGSIARLNDLQLKIQKTVPNVPHEPEKIYDATAEHLLRMWSYLGIFVIVETIIAYFFIRSISKDTRGK